MNFSPTSAKKILKELENERSFLKCLIQQLPDLIWMKDKEGVYLACNHEFELFFGAKEADILGKTDYDFVDKELADFFRQHDQKAMARKVPTVNEEWIKYASDGREILLETTKTAINDADGNLLGVLGIGHDITERSKQEDKLRRSEERLKEAQHLSKVGSWELDFQNDKLFWSEEVFQIFDLDPETFSPSYESFLDAIHPNDRERVDNAYQESITHRKPYSISHRLLLGDQVKYVEEQGQTEFSKDGFHLRSVGTIQDVTERVLYEIKLNRMESLVDHSPDGIFIVEAETARIVDANYSAYHNLGYTEDEMLQLYVWDVSTGIDDLDSWNARLPSLIAEEGEPFEDRHQHKDGHIIPIEITASYIQEPDGNFFLTTSRDISERKLVEKKIQYMAYHDLLTGLPNRSLFADRLHQVISLSDRTNSLLAICYLDLDEFKPINDRFGHEVGDELLVQFSRRLEHELRESDTLARMGGDEFVLMLTGLETIYQAEEIIQRVLKTTEQPFEVQNHRLSVSGSIGVTIYPQDKSDPDTLLRHADQAMYKAKQSGKNQYCLFNPDEDQKVHAYRHFLNEFEQALSENQLTLHYQPRICLIDGKLSSVEALVRWNHPERGMLNPVDFLPIIEGTSLELALDEWVLQEAINQHMRWCNTDTVLPVSVNISPRNVQQQTFSDFIHNLLKQYPDFDPRHLELEVIETSSIGNTSQVAEIMESCTRLGIQFSLDDFGTGYSSLTYFHRLPISILKIDRSFVCDMLDNPQDQDIVEGVIRLAEAINRPVVAEGVESIELGMMLMQLGCQYAQGYGIAKPMPAEKIFNWYDKFLSKSPWSKLQQKQLDPNVSYDLNVAIFTLELWLSKVKSYLLSELRSNRPILNSSMCQFATWYSGIGEHRYGSHPLFPVINYKHKEIHQLAAKLVSMAEKDELDTALNCLDELDKKGAELIALVTALANSPN